MSNSGRKSGADPTRLPAVMLVMASLFVAGCVDPRGLLISHSQLQEQTPFTPVAVSQSWINAPGIVMVMQRGLRGESEQRVALDNRTSVAGENVIVMRAQNLSGRSGRFGFEEFMRRIGGAPEPFDGVVSGDLVTAEDTIGHYFWTEQRFGNDTICVLGIRRITSAQRLLPGSATVLDIMLRNCVRGDVQDALAPLSDGSVSAPPVAGAIPGESRVISPLAAPMVR